MTRTPAGDDRTPNAVRTGHSTNSFASLKFDWLDGLNHDPRIAPWAFKIGYRIMSHVNGETRRGFVSDETLADETSMSVRAVRRARNQLRDVGWITWRRTSKANVYEPLFQRMNAMRDSITIKREERNERRERRRQSTNSYRPKLADPKPQDRTTLAGYDRPELAEHDRPELADILLRGNTVDSTPYRSSASEVELGLGRVSRQSVESMQANATIALSALPARRTIAK